MLVILLACSSPAPEAFDPALAEVRLPPADGPFAPAATQWRGSADAREAFAEVEACAGCHPQAAAGWAGSAHAHASFDNPWYRASVESIRDEVGTPASRHCAGCHDPALLLAQALDDEVDPRDPLARIGVPCLGCHGIRAAGPDGNGSYVLDPSHTAPGPDGPDDHRRAMVSEALSSGAACGACHRGFLDARTGNAAVISGLDDLGAYSASASAGSQAARLDPVEVPRSGCADCHLQDHAFPGGQTALAAQTGHADRVAATLERAVRLHVLPTVQGDDLVVDLVVHNTGVGHRFPGGLGDAQDTWLAVDVLDAGSERIAAVDDPADGRAHRIRAEILDEAGAAERAHRPHRVAVVAWDHTVGPGDARAFRHRFPGAAHARTVLAQVRHRPHGPELQAAACAATGPGTLDGCGPVPELVLAEAKATPGGTVGFEAAYAHGLALTHERPAHLDDARPPLATALALAPDRRSEAAVWVLLARIEGRQGRIDAAIAAADTAEALFGPHPAIDRVRGEALAAVWRWAEAAAAFAPLAASTPSDVATWRDLARARGSAGDRIGALAAASAGLALAPRDPDLLRHQALALGALDHPSWPEARGAWLAHRRRDDAAARRMACDGRVEGCADARLPVPTTVIGSDPTGRSPSR